jgi:hypothetical protein
MPKVYQVYNEAQDFKCIATLDCIDEAIAFAEVQEAVTGLETWAAEYDEI